MRYIFEWLCGILNFGDDFLLIMRNATDNLFTDGGIVTLMEGFIPVGIMMAMVHICKELLEKTTLKNIDMEQIIKMFMKLVVAFALVNNSASLISGMNDLSNAIFDSFQLTVDVSAADLTSYGNKVTGEYLGFEGADLDKFEEITEITSVIGGFINFIPAMFASLFVLLGQIYYAIAVILVSYSRAMNIGYKAMYAPVALSNITGYSTRSAAITYIKELLALFMQLPIAYLGIAFTGLLIENCGTLNAELLVPVIFVIGGRWVSKSATISKELFT